MVRVADNINDMESTIRWDKWKQLAPDSLMKAMLNWVFFTLFLYAIVSCLQVELNKKNSFAKYK